MCQLPKIIFTAIASADEKKLDMITLPINMFIYIT
jgi:hypothetical protein